MAFGLVKRGKIWSFDFRYLGKRFQGTTHLTNHEQAKQWINAYRTNLAKSGVGLVQRTLPPILGDFLKGAFLDSVKQNAKAKGTRDLYELNVRRLREYPPFTQLRLDQIDELAIQGYKQIRLNKKLSPSTINGELRTLRKAMLFAWSCKLCDRIRVSTLPGEKNRIFVVSGELENAYLAKAVYPLKQVAVLMLDLGLRPGECVALRKDDVAGPGVVVTGGKTINARRVLPQTERTQEVLEYCSSLFPDSEWIFPGNQNGHLSAGHVSNLHTQLRKAEKWPEGFVLYSLRHTFASRLAEVVNGDVFLLMKALGHSDVKICSRYVHPSADYLGLAFKQKALLDRLMRGEKEAHLETSSPKTTESA